MSPDHESGLPSADDREEEFQEEEAPRSIFSAAWFRVVLVVLGVGVVGAIAVPYVTEVTQPPPSGVASSDPTPSVAPSAPPPVAVAPASPPIPAAPSAPISSPPVVAEAPKPAPPPASKEPVAPPAEKPAAKAPVAPAAKGEPVARPATTSAGDYFVQVGAFKDQEMAKRVAARLRDQHYRVEESVKHTGAAPAEAPPAAPRATPASAGPDRYDVIVSGGAAADINAKLSAKGLASEASADGVRIRPSLPLRDAVALSKDLGGEGFRVRVRRGAGAGGTTMDVAPPIATDEPRSGALYRVRVGGFPDRPAAEVAMRDLQTKGFQAFIAKGRE